MMTNSTRYITAEILSNFARTLPHAVLTVILLTFGLSLSQIAILQMIYMVIVVLGEFPSGIISDHISRKKMYLGSLITLGIAYFLIFISKGNFFILILAWGIYGVSMAMKSGTLDNEIILEYREAQKDIRNIVNAQSYALSISSIIGAFLGSILYPYIHTYIYILSFISLGFSILIAYSYQPLVLHHKKQALLDEIKLGITILHEEKKLKLIVILIAFTAFFTQILFQYWQVLYETKGISVSLFGYVYIVLQVANIIGTFLYKCYAHKISVMMCVVCSIPILSLGIMYDTEELMFFFLFPIIVIAYYMYNQYMMVLMKEHSPKEFMSTFTSLVSTCHTICGVVALSIISCLVLHISIVSVYIIMFMIFSILSMACLYALKKSCND